MSHPVLILDSQNMEQKLNRLAYEVYEHNFEEKKLAVCGISERGFQLAEKLHGRLREISGLKPELYRISLNKSNPESKEIRFEPGLKDMQEKAVILCDDVLYTGRTLAYAAIPLLQAGVKKLECLVLIHRDHPHYPIRPTYIGMALATTLQEHVKVDFENGKVYLS